MTKHTYLSLCIPTNGITEWVLPVLESIYSQNCNCTEFEVIVTDNGNNQDFKNKMAEYAVLYGNFVYRETDAYMFLNQIEAFKLAKGSFIKFVNHRMILLEGSVQYLINFAKTYEIEKPGVYFSDGKLDFAVKNCSLSDGKLDFTVKNCNLSDENVKKFNSFDEYVRNLSYWSSWSAGTAIWKQDFEKMDLSREFNSLFPHTDIVFANKDKKHYIIDNTCLLSELPSDCRKKGKYDLFYAFAVEYPTIIKNLYEAGHISKATFDFVKKQNGVFVSDIYFNYVIQKKPSSYNLEGYKRAVGTYYSNFEIKFKAYIIAFKNFQVFLPLKKFFK